MGFIGDDEDNANQRFKLELEGKNELIILGLNPSTARGKSSGYPNMIDDPTLKRAVEFSKRNWNWDKTITEFDGFLMLNVCAQSTSKPINLVVNDALHEMNKKKIKKYLFVKNNISVLLAYGDNVSEKKLSFLKRYLGEIVEIFEKHEATFYHLGDLTKKGNPRHIKPQIISQLPITAQLQLIENKFGKTVFDIAKGNGVSRKQDNKGVQNN